MNKNRPARPIVFGIPIHWTLCFVALGSCLFSTALGHPLSTGRQTVPVKAPAQADPAETVFRKLEEIAAKNVWPGFKPSAWPLALYDGEKTLLLRHPNPPAEFKPVPGHPGVLICPGRYPGVEAGSTSDIATPRTSARAIRTARFPSGEEKAWKWRLRLKPGCSRSRSTARSTKSTPGA